MPGSSRLICGLGAAFLAALWVGTPARAQDDPERPNIVFILTDAGYRTAFYGKYLNGYSETDGAAAWLGRVARREQPRLL